MPNVPGSFAPLSVFAIGFRGRPAAFFRPSERRLLHARRLLSHNPGIPGATDHPPAGWAARRCWSSVSTIHTYEIVPPVNQLGQTRRNLPDPSVQSPFVFAVARIFLTSLRAQRLCTGNAYAESSITFLLMPESGRHTDGESHDPPFWFCVLLYYSSI